MSFTDGKIPMKITTWQPTPKGTRDNHSNFVKFSYFLVVYLYIWLFHIKLNTFIYISTSYEYITPQNINAGIM